MKVTREQAEENRQRVLEAAARLFREHGYDGINIGDLMKSVGLTHGGFYGQFDSKEELAAEASELAFERSIRSWKKRAAAHPGAETKAIVDYYLSREHLDDSGSGCVAASLAGEVARQGDRARRVLTEGVEGLTAVLADTMPERTRKARRRHALGSFSAMLGAVILARAVADEALADEILAATRDRL